MEHRLNKNASQQQIKNNYSRSTRQNKEAQLGSESRSGKSYNMNSEQNYIPINKTSLPKDTEPKPRNEETNFRKQNQSQTYP